jgi:hypothetical protein
MVGSTWRSKAAYFMVARKQRKREREREGERARDKIHLSDVPSRQSTSSN